MSNSDNNTSFNEECPVCFSEEGEMLILSCLHKFHEDCLKNHTNLKCPECRQNVLNWPSGLKKEIEKNSKTFVNEMDEEDRQNLQIQENNVERLEMLSNLSMFLQPPPQLEIMTAFQYLQEQGIPMYYLPHKILVSVKKNQPKPQLGILFNTIIGSIQEKIMKDIYEYNKENSDENEENTDDDDLDSDEENPFSEENNILENVDRNFKVIFID
jgi:hypothetical protein